MPRKKEDLKKFIESQKDIESLTEQELMERISALEELGTYPGSTSSGRERQIDNMVAQVRGAFVGQGIAMPESYIREGVIYAIDSLRSGSYDPQGFANIIVSKAGGGREEKAGIFGGRDEGQIIRVSKSIGQDIPKVYTSQVQSGQFEDINEPPLDFKDQISNLRNILSGIGEKRERDIAIQDVLRTLPEELSRGTESFIRGETERGAKTLEEELYPEIQQSLNVRGLLYSGDLQSELARASEQVFGGIQETYADLLEQDDQFFRDAAFRAKIQEISETETDYLEGLERERTRALSESQERFGIAQKGLQRRFEEDIYKRQSERALLTQSQKARRTREQQEISGRAQLIGNIVTPISQIATAGITSKFYPRSGGVTTG